MDNITREGHEVRNVFVAVVEVVGEDTGSGEENEGASGDGFGGIPDVGLGKGVGGGAELLDAEVVVVDEALEKVGIGRLGAHLDAAAHAVKGHGDHGVTGFPADGAVLGIVGDRPHTSLGLDEGLIAIRVVLWREVIDGGVLIEIVGGVGLAFGGGTVSDVVVIVGDIVYGDELVADVVTVLLVVL